MQKTLTHHILIQVNIPGKTPAEYTEERKKGIIDITHPATHIHGTHSHEREREREGWREKREREDRGSIRGGHMSLDYVHSVK